MSIRSTTDNALLMTQARAAMTGRWGRAAQLALLYFLLCFLSGMVPVLGGLLQVLVQAPLLLGFALFMLETVRGGEPPVSRLFAGFDRYPTALGAHVLSLLATLLAVLLFLVPWMLLLGGMGMLGGMSAGENFRLADHQGMMTLMSVGFLLSSVPATIVWLALSMSFYILADEPQTGALAALRKSHAMMRGNKWKYFCLLLRFIGWALLGVITLGIALLWVLPYFAAASVRFYEDISAPQPPQASRADEPFAFLDFSD